MRGFSPRRALIGALVLVGLGVATVAVRATAVQQVERELTARGATWQDREDGVRGATWNDLQLPGVQAERVELDLVPEPRVRVEGVLVDLAALSAGTATTAARPPGGQGSASPPVEAGGVSVTWAGAPVLTDLHGTIRPQVNLEGADGAVLEEAPGSWRVRVRRHVAWGPVSGDARVDAVLGPVSEVTLSMPAATINHPMLAPRPLAPLPLTLTATWTRDTGELHASVLLGLLSAQVDGTVNPDPLSWDLAIDLPDTPLEVVVALFGDQVPEAATATLRGTLGLRTELSGPPLRWRAVPRADGLAADDVIADPTGLRNGPLTWRASTSDGHWIARTTGEGTADWVALADAGLVPDAVIAAEDSSFWTHPGVDVRSIGEALDTAAENGSFTGMRGGSTITQQLAKNLFLDGDRTLSRKLRELLYALELERRLGKERILELYLNVVELGPEVYGLGPATGAYFLKRPDRLTPREAAFLAAILPGPRSGYERAVIGDRPPDARIDAVLSNMADAGSLTRAQATRAQQDRLRFVAPEPR